MAVVSYNEAEVKLLARLRVFNEEIGMSSYKQIYEKILTNGVA